MLSVTDIIQAGNYLVVNPRKLFKIFPKYVPEASGPDSRWNFWHMAKSYDPNREGVHRLMIAKEDCKPGRDAQGRYSPQPTYGVKLLHVKYNKRMGLDFHVFSPNDQENFDIPLRSLHILHGTNPNFQDTALNSLSGLSGMKAWRILGYDQEENPIQIAQFSATSTLAGYANQLKYAEV